MATAETETDVAPAETTTTVPAKPKRARKPTARDTAAHLKQIRRVADLFHQVSDPTRLHILTLLSDGGRNVTAICVAVGGQSQPAVSHHLALLRHGGLIESRRQGKHNVYGLTDAGRALVELVKGVME